MQTTLSLFCHLILTALFLDDFRDRVGMRDGLRRPSPMHHYITKNILNVWLKYKKYGYGGRGNASSNMATI